MNDAISLGVGIVNDTVFLDADLVPIQCCFCPVGAGLVSAQ